MNKGERPYSQIRAMLAISGASLRSITRSPSAIIFILVFPLVFIVVFGFIGSNRIKLEVGVHSQCDTTGSIYREFNGSSNIHLLTEKTDQEMLD